MKLKQGSVQLQIFGGRGLKFSADNSYILDQGMSMCHSNLLQWLKRTPPPFALAAVTNAK